MDSAIYIGTILIIAYLCVASASIIAHFTAALLYIYQKSFAYKMEAINEVVRFIVSKYKFLYPCFYGKKSNAMLLTNTLNPIYAIPSIILLLIELLAPLSFLEKCAEKAYNARMSNIKRG